MLMNWEKNCLFVFIKKFTPDGFRTDSRLLKKTQVKQNNKI
jgi:hypothetical protein